MLPEQCAGLILPFLSCREYRYPHPIRVLLLEATPEEYLLRIHAPENLITEKMHIPDSERLFHRLEIGIGIPELVHLSREGYRYGSISHQDHVPLVNVG